MNVLQMQVESERLAAEGRELLDAALHVDARALRRHPAVVRDDRQLTGAIVDLVELEWNERNAPRAGDDAVDGHAPILIPARVVLEIRNPRIQCAACQQEEPAHGRCKSLDHLSPPSLRSQLPAEAGNTRTAHATQRPREVA